MPHRSTQQENNNPTNADLLTLDMDNRQKSGNQETKEKWSKLSYPLRRQTSN